MPGIELAPPAYEGSGCPVDSVHAELSPDKGKMSISFDAYQAETRSGVGVVRVGCTVAVPLRVPPDLQVCVHRIEYHGFASIPREGEGRFGAEYFFAGIERPTMARRLLGGYHGDFLLTDDLGEEPVWSGCGQDTTVRIRSRVSARKRHDWGPEEAVVKMGTMDTPHAVRQVAEVDIYLRWSRCDD